MDITKIHMIISNCFTNSYASKLENPEEMMIFLGTYELLTLHQEDFKTLTNPVTSNETEIVIENPPA